MTSLFQSHDFSDQRRVLQPPPSPTLSIRDRMGTLRRIINPSNRPLPDTPDDIKRNSLSSRSSIASSVFDTIKKPPSIAMEKIKQQSTLNLDRMTQLQERYRQHQETMKSDGERGSRRTSSASTCNISGQMVSLFRQSFHPISHSNMVIFISKSFMTHPISGSLTLRHEHAPEAWPVT